MVVRHGSSHVPQLTPLVSLQPDLQVLWNPANNPDADHNVIFQLQLNFVWWRRPKTPVRTRALPASGDSDPTMNELTPADAVPYVTSLEELFWGVILVAVSLTMHGFGMLYTLRFSGAYKGRFGRTPTFVSGMLHLILASWMITMAHILEVIMWAGFFQWKQCFVNFSTAVYFSLNEYTTVGSAFNLPQNWRLLEGMIATAGLLGFAWSTGVLLTLAQEFQEQQLLLLKQRREKHRTKPAPAPDAPPGGAHS